MAIEDLFSKDELNLEEMAQVKNLPKWIFLLVYGSSMFIDAQIGKNYHSWVRAQENREIRYYKIE